jgi:site-specific recombinase XerC
MQGDADISTMQYEICYLTTDEPLRLRRHAEARTLQSTEMGTVTAVRTWALLDTLRSSGLRGSGIATFRVGHFSLGYAQTSLVVQRGKGDKQREVFVPQVLKTQLMAFLT